MAKISIQMDAIDKIDIYSDTTFALALEAQKRGHNLFYYEPENLSYIDGEIIAKGRPILWLKKNKNQHFSLGKEQKIFLKNEDIVLMRQDPPFDTAYITYTHLLEIIHPKTLVINNPFEVRNAPEKLFVNKFKEFMPETIITRNIEDINNFKKDYKEIIIKPLYGNGGKQIFYIDKSNKNLQTLLEMFLEKKL